MKKKYIVALIISIVAMVIALAMIVLIINIAIGVIFVSTWALSYGMMSNRMENLNNLTLVSEMSEYLMLDETFSRNYGEIKSIEQVTEYPIQIDNTDKDIRELYMDFDCVTDKGEYIIRVYYVKEDNKVAYRYEEVNGSTFASIRV